MIRHRTASLLAAAAAAALLALAPAPRARAAGSVWGFGDSLVDDGNIPRLLGFFPYPSSYYEGHFSNGPVFLEYLPALLGQNFSPADDFAVGGAFAGTGNLVGSILPGTATEIAQAASRGVRFGPRDTVALWTGSNNDFALLGAGVSGAGVAPAARAVTDAIAADARALVALGARRLVVLDVPDLGLTPAYRGTAQQADATAIAADEDAALPAALRAATAGTGANVTLIDAFDLLRATVSDPAGFGLSNVTASCVATPSCAAAARAAQDGYLFWDDVHPTTGIHDRIAGIVAEVLAAPGTVAVQAQLDLVDAAGFARALVDRARPPVASGFGPGPEPVPDRPVFYLSSTIRHGGFDARGNADGFSYDDGGVVAGAELPVARAAVPGLVVGVAGGAARPTASLAGGAGKLDESAWHAGTYAFLRRPDWHVAIAGDWTGIRDARATRPGLLPGQDTTGAPNADAAGAAFEAGYGPRIGRSAFRLGPEGGLDFARAFLGGYDEVGSPVLTQSVGPQDVASLVGHAGLLLSAAVSDGAWRIGPVATLEAAREFLDTARTLSTGFSTLPIETRLPGYGGTYGRAGVALAARRGRDLSLDGEFTTDFARPGVEERTFRAQAGLAF